MPLNQEDTNLIERLRIGLDGKQLITPEEFTSAFRSRLDSPTNIVEGLISEALTSKNPNEVELAMVVGFNLGFSEVHINILEALAHADWHYSHEDVASALKKINTAECVNALHHLAIWIPDYLAYDDFRALGSKAVWALNDIGTPSSQQALQEIAETQNDLIGELAKEKLSAL